MMIGIGADNLNRRELAKELSAIENGELDAENGSGLIFAITGPPGVGKSCLIDALLHCWTPEKKVAVLAVDPSSPLSGGALLGDRVRMTVLDDDNKADSVFLRSVATRSSSGSIPSIIHDLATHLLAKEFDLVLVETVGAGQSEVRCAAIADRIILVEGPTRGDGIQAEKAGLLELADLVVVNKADLEGAEKVVNHLKISLAIGKNPPMITKVSALTGEGIDELSKMILELQLQQDSLKARMRQRLMMSHEAIITSNPNFELVIDRMAEEGLSVESALEELR
jgi:LAO/AO transport system kinase